jgi:hypothetical protein
MYEKPIVITIVFEDDDVTIHGADKLNYGRLKYLEHKFRLWKEQTRDRMAIPYKAMEKEPAHNKEGE